MLYPTWIIRIERIKKWVLILNPNCKRFSLIFLPSLVVITVISVFIGGGYLAWKYLSNLKLEQDKTTNQTDVSPKKLQVQTPKKKVTSPQEKQTKPTNQQNKTTTSTKAETEYTKVTQPFVFKDPVETQATFSINFDVDITDEFQIKVQHPDGRFLDISRLQHDLFGGVFVFSVQPTDPYVSPIPGTWKLQFNKPVGSSYVIGVTQF